MNSTKLKIGFVFDDSLDSSDGVAQYVKAVGAWLSDQGHEVRYLVGETKIKSWKNGKVYCLSRNVRVSFNGNMVGTPKPASRSAIREILKHEDFDVLHIQVPYSPILAGRVIAATGPSTAIVGTFHIMPANFLARLGTIVLRVICYSTLRKFDQIVSVSAAAKNFAKQSFNVESLVVPNAIDTNFFKAGQPARPANTPKKIVFLGRLVERKGCEYLINAFSIIAKQMPEATLEIAGSGPQQQKLMTLTKKLGLEGSITFHGFVSEMQKAELLASADIACFPSTGGESFGIVLVEAIAAGAGVVMGGDNPGYRSVLGAREACMFNPKNTDQFAHKLTTVFGDDELAKQLHAWQQSVLPAYDVQTVGTQLVSIYRQMIAKRASSKA